VDFHLAHEAQGLRGPVYAVCLRLRERALFPPPRNFSTLR